MGRDWRVVITLTLEEEFLFIHKIKDVLVACHRKANLKLPLQRQVYGPSRYQVYRLGVQEFRIVFHRTFFDMESKTTTLIQLFCVFFEFAQLRYLFVLASSNAFARRPRQCSLGSYGEVDKNRHFYTSLIEDY